VKLPEPRAVLEAAQITATRAAYKALGKEPALSQKNSGAGKPAPDSKRPRP
jgi:hypothetical protein